MKRLLSILVWCMALTSAHASVDSLFIRMPDSLCAYLTPLHRAHLIYTYTREKTDTITNLFNGSTWVDVYEPENNYLSVHVTPNTQWEIWQQEDNIFFIQTYCAPLCYSILTRYDLHWQNPTPWIPNIRGTFISAHFEDGTIRWKDNTPPDEIIP